MKAIVQDRYGAPERVLKLKEIDRPSAGDDDVRIRSNSLFHDLSDGRPPAKCAKWANEGSINKLEGMQPCPAHLNP